MVLAQRCNIEISMDLRKKKIGLRKMENIFYIHTTIFVMKWVAGCTCLFKVFCATTQDIMSIQYKIYDSAPLTFYFRFPTYHRGSSSLKWFGFHPPTLNFTLSRILIILSFSVRECFRLFTNQCPKGSTASACCS